MSEAAVFFFDRASKRVTGCWRLVLLLCCLLAVVSLSGCSTLRKMKQHQAEQQAKQQVKQQVLAPSSEAEAQVLQKISSSDEASLSVEAAENKSEKDSGVRHVKTGRLVLPQATEQAAEQAEETKTEIETETPAAETVVVAQEKPAEKTETLAAGEADSGTLSPERAAQQAEYLRSVIVQSMPLGELMEYSKQRDRSWPLGNFRHKVQTEQLDCVRTLMNAPAYEQYVLGKARRFVLQHRQLVPQAMALLDTGGGRFLRLMSQTVLDKAAGKAVSRDIAAALTETEKQQAIMLLRDPDLEPVRELVGISRVRNSATGKTRNNYTRRATNTLALLALEQCGVDARGLLSNTP